MRCLALFATAAALVAGCAADPGDDVETSEQNEAISRSFTAHPAIVEVETADHVYAVSDVHGQYDVFVRLLAANKLIAKFEASPAKVKWTGGTATLLVLGDHIDKGPRSIDVIDLLRSLEEQAPRTGGRAIALMGNHEAEFLADPTNSKATSSGLDEEGIAPQLTKMGIDPMKLAAGRDKEGRGKWLASMPLGVRVKKWFFAHGGNTQRMSLFDLNTKLQNSIKNNGWGDKDITGGNSILQSQKWYGNHKDANAGQKEIEALGHVEHIVFGHDPGAFDSRGRPRQSKNGMLVKIDGAMGLHEDKSTNPGFMLHVSTKGKDFAEVVDEAGKVSPLD